MQTAEHLRLILILSFLTNFGRAPAGPGNFRFLFVDTTACALSEQCVAAVGGDLTGNKGLV